MYRIPKDLDLSRIVGTYTSQVRVGKYDIQFSFGKTHFFIQSQIDLIKDGEIMGVWREGSWPPLEFFEIMNVDVVSCQIPNDRTIEITLKNEIKIVLKDDSDQFECMQISVEGDPDQWII